MKIRRGWMYIFRKSGNKVEAVEPTSYGGQGHWVVRRVDGASAGKEMVVPRCGLEQRSLQQTRAASPTNC